MATIIKLYYTDRNDTYKEWELIPNKLLIVEDIASYLATKSIMTFSDIQYIKNELEIGVNLDLSQSYAQPKATTSFKYVAIQNPNELVHYYFVKKITWRSKTTIRLELVLDVLNTFQEGYDYEFKENTRIIREHRDRLYNYRSTITLNYQITLQSGTLNNLDKVRLINDHGDIVFSGVCEDIDQYRALITITSNESEADIKQAIDDFLEDDFELQNIDTPATYYMISIESYSIQHTTYRKIDYISEGINPVLIRNTPSDIEDTGVLNKDWYLLYRNQNDPSDSLVNPVECYLIPEEDVETDSGYISSGRLIPSWLEEGKYYFFFIGSGQTCTLSNGVTATYSTGYNSILITKAGNKINATFYKVSTSYVMKIVWQYDDLTYLTFSAMPTEYNKLNSISNIDGVAIANMSYPYEFEDSEGYNIIDNINMVDRTDAKNIKLIKLPYCPFDFTENEGVLEIDNTNWELSSITQANGGVIHALKLINLNTKLENTISASSNNPFTNLRVSGVNPAVTDLRKSLATGLESKLFHSDFYSPSYVYDSFSVKVDLEKCDLSYYIANGVASNSIKFNMTSTINSKFMFTLLDYSCDKADVNFYSVVPIARNNEIVLYNVPYINYIRTGFNYDIKNKNTQNISNVVGIGLSAGSMAVSLAMPSVPLKVAGVVASIVSMAMSVKNTIVSAIQSDNAIKQKQDQYKNQASSVAGSDDVDLMSEYCGNRLKYFVYTPTDMMKNLLNDLFFYAGYNTNRMGKPTHNNRVNFDYLECEASIQAISSIPDECLTELINCFKTGCTYLHKTTRAVDKWDFAQKYENWENSLL